jgi:hypothetical protein
MKLKLEIAGKVFASIFLMLGCFILAIFLANLISDGPMDVKGDFVRNLPWALPLAIAVGLIITVINNRNPQN